MPIYEFVCGECASRFDELLAVGTDHTTCPACGADGAVRRFSAPAPPRALTMSSGQARRAESGRGVERGGALQRFKQRRAAEKRTGGGRG
jgi:putative FmdB family regulatory protein